MNDPAVRLCFHRHTTEIYGTGDETLPPDVPTHYKCLECGSTFPLIGDTDQWDPVEITVRPPGTTRVSGYATSVERDHIERRGGL